MQVWDLREGQLFYTLYGHEGAISGVAFSPAGDFFASAGADEQARLCTSLPTWPGLVHCLPDDPPAPPGELCRDSLPHISHKLSPDCLLCWQSRAVSTEHSRRCEQSAATGSVTWT